jgi:DNA-binding transcriptional regulator YiaG
MTPHLTSRGMTFVNSKAITTRDVLEPSGRATWRDMPRRKPRDESASEMLQAAGRRLAAIREAMGITQEQLAALIGTTRGALAMWEGGTNKPDSLALARAQKHGIPMEWVMLGDPRHVEYGVIPALLERCADLLAPVGGPTLESPAMAASRKAVSPSAPPAAEPPRPRGVSLHEARSGFSEDQAPPPMPPRTRRRRAHQGD